MPVIVVYGVPSDTARSILRSMVTDYQITLSQIPELNISGNDVSVFFPADLILESRDEQILIFVKGLYEKPERTESVIAKIAEALGKLTKQFYFSHALVECFVEPIKPNRCWSSA